MKKISYIFGVNILLIILITVFLETILFFSAIIFGYSNLGWIKSPSIPILHKEVEDPCERMISHPFYSHTHDHENKCEVINGFVDGPFVFYNDSIKSEKSIIVLGGSTTDGLYKKFSNQKNWAYFLSKLLMEKNHNINVINGGVGGYSSSQELFKLIIDGMQIETQIKIVISLNGINNVSGYKELKQLNISEEVFPFWTKKQFESFSQKKYIIQDKRGIPPLFPNIARLIRYLGEKFNNKENLDWYKSVFFKKKKKIDSSDLWFQNIRMIKAITKEFGIDYYVFLQPTMGLKGIQTPKDIKSNDFKLFENYKSNYGENSDLYINNLNKSYSKMKNLCSKLDYCYDISDIAPPGDNYSDIRHHNEKGNYIISKEIYSIIKNSL